MKRIEMGGWASVEAINDHCMHDYNLSKKIELQSTKLMKLHEDRHMRSKEEQLEKTKRR